MIIWVNTLICAVIGAAFGFLDGNRTIKSSRGRRLTAPSHTTGHAGPHPAVHRERHPSWRWIFLRLVPGTTQPSAQLPQASPILLAQQCLYPRRSAFFVVPRTALRTHPLDVQPFPALAGTMAPADFCRLSLTSRSGLPFPASRQTSPGKNADFPCTPAPFSASALGRIGLRCYWPTRPASQPPMRFVFLKSQVCLRLPSDPALTTAPLPSASGWCDQPPQGSFTL